MNWRMIIAAIVTVLLSACGAGKSATSTSGAGVTDGEEQPGLTKAEIDTLQHEAARLAMEQGEFVFMVSRIIYYGRGVPTKPLSNYMEITDGKFFFQGDVFVKRPPLRTSGKVSKMDVIEDSPAYKMSIKIYSRMYCDITDVMLTLYPGTNKAFGVLDGRVRMDIEGVIVPRRLANISRSARPSEAEVLNIL